MDPTVVVSSETVVPWYRELVTSIGPLAATLLVFLAAFGVIIWKISLAVICAWRDERREHRKDIDNLVLRLDDRDKFQREEIVGIARAYERTAAAQIAALEKIEAVIEPLNTELLTRPCLLSDQKRAILETVREEAAALFHHTKGGSK